VTEGRKEARKDGEVIKDDGREEGRTDVTVGK
jgi:hypothetical protein